ncbi:unnamed protein product [Chrysodeixis includens]|uniref:Sperm microtubule inner protein 1 C-terminal domain-containing protein n=1 Tax=Chrysodeixis includens TaxID=689277 RepID=A0A9P0BQG7_CHRIL|nr:unnamed protein product [Chrysodeixis includens]
MPFDITKPSAILFFQEMYEREKRLRAQWVFSHQAKMQKAVTLNREMTNYYESDVDAHTMLGGMDIISRDHKNAGEVRRKVPIRDAHTIKCAKDIRDGYSIVKLGLGDPKVDPRLARPNTDASFDPVMRPVDPKLTKVLYKARPVFGRQRYLKLRGLEWPEKKFYFPECSNWDYGWRMTDSSGIQRCPEYGRHWLLNRTLNSRVGPQPDPWHYKKADIPGVSKCIAL